MSCIRRLLLQGITNIPFGNSCNGDSHEFGDYSAVAAIFPDNLTLDLAPDWLFHKKVKYDIH